MNLSPVFQALHKLNDDAYSEYSEFEGINGLTNTGDMLLNWAQSDANDVEDQGICLVDLATAKIIKGRFQESAEAAKTAMKAHFDQCLTSNLSLMIADTANDLSWQGDDESAPYWNQDQYEEMLNFAKVPMYERRLCLLGSERSLTYLYACCRIWLLRLEIVAGTWFLLYMLPATISSLI